MILPPYYAWTTYTPVIPKLYWDVYSQEERIKRICLELDKLCHYASAIAEQVNENSEAIEGVVNTVESILADFQDNINKQLEEQQQMIDYELEEMRRYIDRKFDEYSAGTQTYDVTTGKYRPSSQAMRRLFQALSYDHVGNRQLVSNYADNMKVSEMSDITVYNAAYSERPTITINDQYGG